MTRKLIEGVRVLNVGSDPARRVTGVAATPPVAVGLKAVGAVIGRGPAGPRGQNGDAATQAMLTQADAKLAELDTALADTAQGTQAAIARLDAIPVLLNGVTFGPPTPHPGGGTLRSLTPAPGTTTALTARAHPGGGLLYALGGNA